MFVDFIKYALSSLITGTSRQ